jgi:hypothetical protein
LRDADDERTDDSHPMIMPPERRIVTIGRLWAIRERVDRRHETCNIIVVRSSPAPAIATSGAGKPMACAFVSRLALKRARGHHPGWWRQGNPEGQDHR